MPNFTPLYPIDIMHRHLLTLLLGLLTLTLDAQTSADLRYMLACDGAPHAVSLSVAGHTYQGFGDQGTAVVVERELTLDDIAVHCADGYAAHVLLDDANRQIQVACKRCIVPAQDTTDTAHTYVLCDAAGRYVRLDGDSVVCDVARAKADVFVFLCAAESPGHYLVYDVTAGQYLTPIAQRLVGDDCDLTRVHLAPSLWYVEDSRRGALACATLLYSLPGAAYMHKLIPEAGRSVVGVDFGHLDGLTLRRDRARYAYVCGTAPEREGTYTYTVALDDGTASVVTLVVDAFLPSPTPTMGWLSWNWFQHSICAENMTAIAQGLQDKGLVAAGYTTLVLDDTWGEPTTDKAALDWHRTKFPDPAAFVRSVKQRGLRLGLYADAGSMTCENFQPGSYGYEAQHLAKFDGWGIDFLKYDRCNAEGEVQEAYARMGKAIARLNVRRRAEGGRVPFVFNACEWGDHQPWLWGAEAGASSWRACHDVREDWCGTDSRPGVLYASDVVRHHWMYAGVNRYNDLDMMCIGLHGLGGPSNNTADHQSNGGKVAGLTPAQARSQMSLWCVLASPLSITCDVRATPAADGNAEAGLLPAPLITSDDLAILTNADIIAINQDALGQQAEYMPHLSRDDADGTTRDGAYSVYLKDLTGGRMALAVVNRSPSAALSSQTFRLSDLYLDAAQTYAVKDVWTGSVRTCTGVLATGDFAASETKVLLIAPAEE